MTATRDYKRLMQAANLRLEADMARALGAGSVEVFSEKQALYTIQGQDAQIERLARRVADAELELAQTLRILQSEQKAHLKLVNRICEALGTWLGPWDDAAVKAIKESRK